MGKFQENPHSYYRYYSRNSPGLLIRLLLALFQWIGVESGQLDGVGCNELVRWGALIRNNRGDLPLLHESPSTNLCRIVTSTLTCLTIHHLYEYGVGQQRITLAESNQTALLFLAICYQISPSFNPLQSFVQPFLPILHSSISIFPNLLSHPDSNLVCFFCNVNQPPP